METIAALTGTDIPEVMGPTVQAFGPLLNKKRAQILGHPARTFKYGSTDRHQLDVYYPDPASVTGSSVPVMFFEYGGGFVSGGRKYDPPQEIVYTNLGMFFALRGVMVVIADYRLAPEFKFPQPMEDVRDAISWFLSNPSIVLADNPAGLPQTVDISKVIVMGHSAGTNHVASLYLSPSVLPVDSPVRAATLGLVLVGGAFIFSLSSPGLPPIILQQYYGSEEAALANMPFTLLQDGPEALITGLPETYFLASENEPSFLAETIPVFIKKVDERTGKASKFEIMKGHNHISPHWALMSGEGEQWGENVAAWVKAKF